MVVKSKSLIFHKCSDSYEKINHAGLAAWRDFYPTQKALSISKEVYGIFLKEFKDWKCINTKDWLREYKLADVSLFIQALKKVTVQGNSTIQRKYILKEAIVFFYHQFPQTYPSPRLFICLTRQGNFQNYPLFLAHQHQPQYLFLDYKP